MLLQSLLADPDVAQVHALSCRALSLSHPKLKVHIVDFSHFPMHPKADEPQVAQFPTGGQPVGGR